MTDDATEALLLDVRARLQHVEDMLIADGRSAILVATNAGTFEWKKGPMGPHVVRPTGSIPE